MQIDWLTVSAQIVNFLVLVWLLQHFLYGPITRAMAAREARIENRLEEAEAKRRDAEAAEARFHARERDLEQEREQVLHEAETKAKARRREREEAARAEIEDRRRAWREQLEAERQRFLDGLRRRVSDAFYALARRALADLADVELEARIAHGFAARLRELDAETRAELQQAAGEGVTVRSRFTLEPEAKRVVTRAVHEAVDAEVEVAYEAGEETACGIALHAGSRRVAWTLERYLDDFTRAVAEALDAATAGQGA